MDGLDYLGECRVVTPAGLVEVSLASHADGARSAIAWLLPAGRRIACLRWQPGQPRPEDEWLDPVLTSPAVRQAMLALLTAPPAGCVGAEPEGSRLVGAGRLTAAELDDLRGWQWLLAELGAPRPLEELAQAAGMTGE